MPSVKTILFIIFYIATTSLVAYFSAIGSGIVITYALGRNLDDGCDPSEPKSLCSDSYRCYASKIGLYIVCPAYGVGMVVITLISSSLYTLYMRQRPDYNQLYNV